MMFKRFLAAMTMAVCLPFAAHAAEDAGIPGDAIFGNLEFDAGGLDVDFVFGNNVIDASVSGDTLTLMVQRETGCTDPTFLCDVDAVTFAGGGADNFVGARVSISPVRTGQDYSTLTTLTWDVEEFDVGGFFDPASNSRMTVPSGVTYAVVHGGVTLGGFASTGDLFIDILQNGVSLGIGSTTKNIGISTEARTSVTTGVIEVSEGDYFEIAIRVVQDDSVSLQPIGTFFSTHASSTEIGGSSPDTNDYVSSIAFGLVGQDLTLTLDRTGLLPAISGSITLPSGGGGTTVTPVAYSAPLEDIAATTYGTATQILNLGTEEFNLGSFTVDDTGTTDRIVIPEDGLYELILSLHAVGDNRTVITGRFTVDNGTDPEAAIAGQGSGYVRGLSTENFIIAEHAHFAQLSAGDMIGVTLVSSATSVNLSIVGASSSIEVIKIGGAQGAAGQGVVAGGTVGQVLGKASAADYDTAWVDQTGGGTGFLPLTGGTLTGRLTMDITGNNEGLVINHPGGTSESAAHFFTSTTGVQKAVQASRSGQSTAFFSIEGRLGGSNTQPGIALGGGTGARDTELYRDSANNWKTPDFFTAQGYSITGVPLTTWNSFGINDVLSGPPTLAGTDLTFTELDGTQTVIALPTTGGTGTDRYVTNITTTLDSSAPRRFTIQLTRNEGLPTLSTTHNVPNETPNGGAAGELLAKATAADHDFEYIDPSTLITGATIFPTVNAIIEQGTGITITRDAANNAIRIASDTAPWALVANTDVIVPGKLGSGVTSPDVALFGDGTWKTPLDGIADWAHQTNTDVIPAGKLGTGTTDQTTVLYGDGAFRVPGFLTAAGVYDWAEEGNVDRLPIDKMPSVLRTVNNFAYDAASRQLGMFFTNTVGISEQTQVILPDFLVAADVAVFDIHDVILTPANIQAADRFIFSDESVAGDPMRYARADALVPYVLGQIADSDIPGTLTRDSEVEPFALLAHPTAVVGYDKMSPVVRSLSALIYNVTTRQISATTTLSSGNTETSTTGAFPEWITAAGVYDWAEQGNTDTLPVSKIPNLNANKISNFNEALEDRVATSLLQPGSNITWGYDDAAGTLTPTVSTDTAAIRQDHPERHRGHGRAHRGIRHLRQHADRRP